MERSINARMIFAVQLLRPIYKRMADNHNAEIFAANTLLVVLGTSVLTARVRESFLMSFLSSGPTLDLLNICN